MVTLQGELGAGKTTFTRHLLRTLGVEGRIKSPTYSVMEAYEVHGSGLAWPVSHFDFYRFSDPQEWEDAGFRDVFASPGMKLCEWPQRAAALMPPPDLAVELCMAVESESPSGRRVNLNAHSTVGLSLLRAMRAAGSLKA